VGARAPWPAVRRPPRASGSGEGVGRLSRLKSGVRNGPALVPRTGRCGGSSAPHRTERDPAYAASWLMVSTTIRLPAAVRTVAAPTRSAAPQPARTTRLPTRRPSRDCTLPRQARSVLTVGVKGCVLRYPRQHRLHRVGGRMRNSLARGSVMPAAQTKTWANGSQDSTTSARPVRNRRARPCVGSVTRRDLGGPDQ
jgi:hypothetical protein